MNVLDLPKLSSLVDELSQTGNGLVMTMGKGGVGKTTIAASVAVSLAKRGHKVHLTTSDPAAHLSYTLDGSLPNLQVSRIDPKVETERYRRFVLENQGKGLDAEGLAVLEEDLRSPCTEEIAVFRAFSRSSKKQTTILSLWIQPQQVTRFCYWMQQEPITGKWCARWGKRMTIC